MREVTVLVPATSANLGPGFDCLGLSLSLYNEITLCLTDNPGVELEVLGEGAEELSGEGDNIFWQSVRFLLSKGKITFKGAKASMINRIPLSRGLGSSAAAIVGGLFAANVAVGEPFHKRELLDFATEIEGHPDNVAPAILGGVTVSITKDGKAKSISFLPKTDLEIVVCVPDFHLSTEMAREILPHAYPRQDAIFNIGRSSMLIAALMGGEAEYISCAMDDVMHQPYRAYFVPGMMDTIRAAKRAGALGAALSGAGPSLIALCPKDTACAQKVGAAMEKAFAEQKVVSKSMILKIDTKGASQSRTLDRASHAL